MSHGAHKTIRHTGTALMQDKSGNPFHVERFTDFWIFPSGAETEGLHTYQLPDGEHVNQINETEFKTLLGEIELTLVRFI